jgi:ADP-ribosyl-[dinitrogen reductase] hydrolase
MCDLDFYFKQQVYRKVRYDFLNVYSVVPQDHPERLRLSPLLSQITHEAKFDPVPLAIPTAESRALAAVLGMAVADALGASTEFEYFEKEGLGVIK